jgi:hypothetical protein
MSNRLLRGLGVGAALTALWLGIVAGPAAAAGSVRWVDDGGSGGPHACASAAYTSIQAAINATPAWGTVKVCPGTYAEQIVVNKKGVTVESARLHAAHIVAPASLDEFDGEAALVLLNGWADKLIGFDIGIASGDLPPAAGASTSGVVAQDGTCAHVDTAVWSLNGRQTIRRNLIHPNGPYSLSGECGYDYGIVFGASDIVATTDSGTTLTGAEVSRAANNKITDFRFGGILAESPTVKVHIDHNRLLFLHTKDPKCSVPLSAKSASTAACVFAAPDKINGHSVQSVLSHAPITTAANPSQVNSEFIESFGIGAEAGAAVDVDYNNVHSGLSVISESNSVLAAGIWLIDADGSSRIFNNIVTNVFVGIAMGEGFAVDSAPVAHPAVATDGTYILRNQMFSNFLGIGIDSDANNVTQNTSTANFIGGIEVSDGTSSNLIHGNNFAYNIEGVDCQDNSIGTGTLGTNNTWTNNLGVTSDPTGLCTDPNPPAPVIAH